MKNKSILNDDYLNDLFDEASQVDGSSEKQDNVTKAKSSEPLNFEIRETDDLFRVRLKEMINNCQITLQDLYNIKTQNDGYNMKYSLDKKGQLGLDRIMLWCKVLHKVPDLVFRDMTEDEAKQADEELKKELEEKLNKDSNKKKKKR